MSVYLIAIAAVILICIWLDKISFKIGVPTLLAFILLGMAFGSDGILKIPFNNLPFAEKVCSFALIFIMFYGGFGTKWKEARSVAPVSVLMSTFGVFITAGLTGLFCYYGLKMEFYESLLFGSLISSTDAASVFSILRSRKLNLKYNTASLLELESGSNDPSSYMLTVICISLLKGNIKRGMLFKMLLSQIILGVAFGVLTAWLALLVLRNERIRAEGYDAVFVIAVAIASYALPDMIGGNGYLSAYIAGIILGNAPGYEKKGLVHFFDGLTGLMQIVIFFLLGLVAFPSKLPSVAINSFFIALFLTFIARPIATFILMAPFKCPFRQQLIVAWSGLRGAASIVFAIMASVSIDTDNDLLHMVFCIVLFSILLQGSLLPVLSVKLDMIDDHLDVMKTFTDYTEETPMQFIQLCIPNDYSYVGKKLKDYPIPPGSLVVLIKRNDSNIIPDGDTVIKGGDTLILTGETSPEYIEGMDLSELTLDEDSEWCGQRISDIPKRKDSLFIIVKRGNNSFIPTGDTVLNAGDTLVINQLK